MANHEWLIGIDLGGTKLRIAAIGLDGKVIEILQFSTPKGSEAVIEKIEKEIKQLIHNHDGSPLSVGIGIAGQIERKTGIVDYAPNLEWHRVPLKKKLEDALSLPVSVLNDVQAATWGEWSQGAGKGVDDLLCVFIGTGVGGGIVSGGHFLFGNSGAAGEVGHLIIHPKGHRCRCGNRGCLEAYVGGWALSRQFERYYQSEDGSPLTGRDVVGQYRAGNEDAAMIMNEATNHLIAAVSGLSQTLNPKLILLGGGMIEGFPEYIRSLKERIPDHTLPSISSGLRIRPCSLGGHAGVIGAAFFGKHSLEKVNS